MIYRMTIVVYKYIIIKIHQIQYEISNDILNSQHTINNIYSIPGLIKIIIFYENRKTLLIA